MRKGLFTLLVLALTVSMMFALSLAVSADYELNTVAVVDGVEYTSFDAAVNAAQTTPVNGIFDKNTVGKENVVFIVKEGTYTVTTDTVVGVVATVDGVTVNYAGNVDEITTKSFEFDGDTYTASFVANTSYLVAVVGDDVYTDLDKAIAAAEASNITGATKTPVIVIGAGTYAVDTDKVVVVAVYDKAKTNVTVSDFSYKVEVEYDGGKYTAYALFDEEYLFNLAADRVNEAVPGVDAVYTGNGFDFTFSTDDLKKILDKETYKEIFFEFAPVIVLGDEVYVNDILVYDNGVFVVGNFFKAFNSLGLTPASVAALDSKTFASVDIKVVNATNTTEFTSTFTLGISDKKFEKVKSIAARVDELIDYVISDLGNVTVDLDATPIVDLLVEKLEEKGKTVKEIRDFINETNLHDVVELLEGYGFTGKKAELVEVFAKIVDKFAASEYGSYTYMTLGLLDMDLNGVYEYENEFTVEYSKYIEKAIAKVKARYPEFADRIAIDNIPTGDSITVTIDLTIKAFDMYTVKFVDADGNILYELTLLEGEEYGIDLYTFTIPEKENYDRYVCVFKAWFDGTTEFAYDANGEIKFPALTEDVTYTPVFEDVSVFAFATVTYKSSFDLNMYLEKALLEENFAEYYIAVYNSATGETVEYYPEDLAVNCGYYQIVYTGIAAKELGDVLTFTLYADGEEFALDYSAKQYLMNQLNAYRDDADYARLIVDSLVYGAKAQERFDYNVDALATSELTAEDLALGTQTTPTYDNDFVCVDNETDLVKFYRASLVYENNVKLKFYFDFSEYTEDVTSCIISVKLPGQKEAQLINVADIFDLEEGEFTMSENGSYYQFSIDTYMSYELREECTITVLDAEGNAISDTVTFGPETYAYGKFNSTSTTELTKAVLEALFNYADSAKVVFDSADNA